MTEWLCYNCIYCNGMKDDDWVICGRITECYVRLKLRCNYFKPINTGGKV